MPDQNKNAQPASSEKQPKNAGGIDEGEERLDQEDRVEEDNARQADGSRRSPSEESDSSDGR
jgi:hypothetical protein